MLSESHRIIFFISQKLDPNLDGIFYLGLSFRFHLKSMRPQNTCGFGVYRVRTGERERTLKNPRPRPPLCLSSLNVVKPPHGIYSRLAVVLAGVWTGLPKGNNKKTASRPVREFETAAPCICEYTAEARFFFLLSFLLSFIPSFFLYFSLL